MKPTKQIFLASALFASTTAFNAYASFVSQDSTFGANTITLDTTTGLQWLNIKIARGQSFDFVSGYFGVGGYYQGFRGAYIEEVESLFSEFGITAYTNSQTVGLYASASAVEAQLGITLSLGAYKETMGWALSIPYDAQHPDRNSVKLIGVASDATNGSLSTGAAWGGAGGVSESSSYSQQYTSVWLVKDPSPIPAPAAIWLFGSGLIGLASTARHKFKAT